MNHLGEPRDGTDGATAPFPEQQGGKRNGNKRCKRMCVAKRVKAQRAEGYGRSERK